MASSAAYVDMDRPPVPPARLWAGVLLAPASWLAAEMVGYYLATRGCEGAAGPAAPEAASHVRTVLIVLEAAFGILAAVGLAVALANRRAVRDAPDAAAPPAWGRARFMARAGVLASALFLLGIALFALPSFLVNVCSRAR